MDNGSGERSGRAESVLLVDDVRRFGDGRACRIASTSSEALQCFLSTVTGPVPSSRSRGVTDAGGVVLGGQAGHGLDCRSGNRWSVR